MRWRTAPHSRVEPIATRTHDQRLGKLPGTVKSLSLSLVAPRTLATLTSRLTIAAGEAIEAHLPFMKGSGCSFRDPVLDHRRLTVQSISVRPKKTKSRRALDDGFGPAAQPRGNGVASTASTTRGCTTPIVLHPPLRRWQPSPSSGRGASTPPPPPPPCRGRHHHAAGYPLDRAAPGVPSPRSGRPRAASARPRVAAAALPRRVRARRRRVGFPLLRLPHGRDLPFFLFPH